MSSSSPEMAHAFVLPVPISVSATFGDFLASEAQLPMAPHTLNSADVSTSRLAPKAMRRDWPVESSAKTALKDCLKMLPVYDSDMTTWPPVFSGSARISIRPTWSSAHAKVSHTSSVAITGHQWQSVVIRPTWSSAHAKMSHTCPAATARFATAA